MIFLLLFSLPLFLFAKDTPGNKETRLNFRQILSKALGELKATLIEIKSFSGALPKFLLASFVCNDAVNTTPIFLVLFAREVIGVTIQQFFLAFAIMAGGSAIGALIFGKLSDLLGPKKSLSIAISGWIFVIIYLLLDPSFADLIIAGTVGGAMLGGIWTMNRHVITKITPPHKLAQILGIESLTERLSGIIGPIAVGALIVSFGYTPALIFIISLFIAGLALLRLVKV